MKLKDQQKKIKGCFELSKSCTCHISCQTLAVMCGLQSRQSHGGLKPVLFFLNMPSIFFFKKKK